MQRAPFCTKPESRRALHRHPNTPLRRETQARLATLEQERAILLNNALAEMQEAAQKLE